ncbi:uncharacterized protein EDB91DRAFT_1110029 [Suillus paluster]|uniref:uncharacterized protein n=1 Tax=Suillus paluster TaxID=48578 RepID=UPI001B8665FD|nr:uncharacterized protein EDB91DRAFT_1110029 [Suillus paluster]KAG1749864.1 hypothetical protein EDB91DRAFT_1110029 [Suillus paluster]
MSYSNYFGPLSPTTSRGEHSDADSEVLVRKPIPFKQPPPEILLQILESTLPPTVFLDASLSGGPFSPWCMAQRIKQSVVLVCKFWREIGTVLLYREVHLRRIGQIAALWRTLQGNARFGEMIMDINVSCLVTPHYFVMFDEALRRILKMSPNASRVYLNMDMSLCDVFICSLHRYDLSKVVHLDIGDEIHLSDILPCLPQCKNLTILSLSIHTYQQDDVEFLTLERLQELQITVKSPSRCNLNFLHTMAQKWKLPCLCRFMVYEHRPRPHQVPQYIYFLDVHGKHLTALSITAPLDTLAHDLRVQHVQMVLDCCPALEHLALFPPMTETPGPGPAHEPILGMQHIQILLDRCSTLDASLAPHGKTLLHKTLRWIDIWATWHPSAPDPDVIRVSWKSQCFPQLKAIRLLDWALLNTTGPRLHLIIPPDSVQHHETLQWRFPGVHVQYAAGHIYRRDMDYVSSFLAACGGHESLRSIGGGLDSISEDSDLDSDDKTFRSVSSASYSAYDSEEGDLETREYDFPFVHDRESVSEPETTVDFEMLLQIYRDTLNTECDL